MTYEEAIQKSFTVRWKTGTCSQGEICWCRTITCEEPIMFMDGSVEEEYFIARSGELSKRVAEYFVNLHNANIK